MCWSDGFCRLEIPCGHLWQQCCDGDVGDVSRTSATADVALFALGKAEAALGAHAELDGLKEVILDDVALDASARASAQSGALSDGVSRRA